MKDFIKKNWKIILICLLTLLWFQKCTQSCTRQQKLEAQQKECIKLDSIQSEQLMNIKELLDKNTYLENMLKTEMEHNDKYSDIAIYNQKELIDKINKLNKENNQLKKEIKKLKETIKEQNNKN